MSITRQVSITLMQGSVLLLMWFCFALFLSSMESVSPPVDSTNIFFVVLAALIVVGLVMGANAGHFSQQLWYCIVAMVISYFTAVSILALHSW